MVRKNGCLAAALAAAVFLGFAALDAGAIGETFIVYSRCVSNQDCLALYPSGCCVTQTTPRRVVVPTSTVPTCMNGDLDECCVQQNLLEADKKYCSGLWAYSTTGPSNCQVLSYDYYAPTKCLDFHYQCRTPTLAEYYNDCFPF